MSVKKTFTDIDEHAAQMAGFDQHYVQLSPGPFNGVFASIALPHGIGFDVEWVAQSLHQQAAVPQHTVSLITFLELKGRAIFNGCEVMSLDTVFLGPGTALDLRTPPGAAIAVVTIPEPVFESRASQWGEPARPRSGADAMRLLGAARYATLLRPALLPLLQVLETSPERLSDAHVAEAMADGLLESATLLPGHRDESADRTQLLSARRRRDAFLSAKDAIDRLDSEDISMTALCRIAGVSRRTLEYCFDEALAMSPMQYLKLKRLNAVRRELGHAAKTGTTIGDVAARYGLWHLSRLAKEYEQLFGELPSATLRRGRSSARAPESRKASRHAELTNRGGLT